MWKKCLAFFGMLTLIILLDPTTTPAQPPGGKDRRGGGEGMKMTFPGGGEGGPKVYTFGGPGGGSVEGMKMTFPGGGMPGGGGEGMKMQFGGGGGMPGGGRGMGGRIDPEAGWKMLSGATGGDGNTVDMSKMSPQMYSIVKGIADRAGVPPLPESGVISRDQYLDYHSRLDAARAANSGGPPGGGPPGGGRGGNEGRGGWDMGGGGWDMGGWGGGGWGGGQRPNDKKEPEEEPRPVAMRYGKLPSGLPGWFNDLDADKDGQISMYEWRKGGKDMNEFTDMDLNSDGLVTADEYLRFTRMRSLEVKVDAYEQKGERPAGSWGIGEKPDSKNDSKGGDANRGRGWNTPNNNSKEAPKGKR